MKNNFSLRSLNKIKVRQCLCEARPEKKKRHEKLFMDVQKTKVVDSVSVISTFDTFNATVVKRVLDSPSLSFDPRLFRIQFLVFILSSGSSAVQLDSLAVTSLKGAGRHHTNTGEKGGVHGALRGSLGPLHRDVTLMAGSDGQGWARKHWQGKVVMAALLSCGG